jgi:hypothetical protein
MRPIAFLFFFLFLFTKGYTQQTSTSLPYQLLSGNNYVQSKNYYLLTLFNEVPAVKSLLQKDPALAKITADKRDEINTATRTCSGNLGCYIKAVKISGDQAKAISERLSLLFEQNKELQLMVSAHLIPSGCYNLYAGLGNQQLLVKAWEQDVKALNHAISVYAEGQQANYPKIDSIAFNVKAKGYTELVALNAGLAIAETTKQALFYSATLAFALHSLEINERNQIADEEPMVAGANKAAYGLSKKVKWAAYKYTLILVPGEGPEERDVALSAGGMLRCRLAAVQYAKGLAPFIMVSGGCVHPYKTKYNEAVEMKKFLMQSLHIPEEAILIEPHARHTTTNIRNCARLIYRYGFPMDKPCITSTAKSQSYYITDVVPDRCFTEFGYKPYRNGTRLSDTEAEFYPLAVSLQLDFDEPMDP